VKTIEFDATFCDKMKHVQIVWPAGANGAIYILIDNYLEGQMVYQMGECRAYLNARTILTGDDITILGEIIESHSI